MVQLGLKEYGGLYFIILLKKCFEVLDERVILDDDM